MANTLRSTAIAGLSALVLAGCSVNREHSRLVDPFQSNSSSYSQPAEPAPLPTTQSQLIQIQSYSEPKTTEPVYLKETKTNPPAKAPSLDSDLPLKNPLRETLPLPPVPTDSPSTTTPLTPATPSTPSYSTQPRLRYPDTSVPTNANNDTDIRCPMPRLDSACDTTEDCKLKSFFSDKTFGAHVSETYSAGILRPFGLLIDKSSTPTMISEADARFGNSEAFLRAYGRFSYALPEKTVIEDDFGVDLTARLPFTDCLYVTGGLEHDTIALCNNQANFAKLGVSKTGCLFDFDVTGYTNIDKGEGGVLLTGMARHLFPVTEHLAIGPRVDLAWANNFYDALYTKTGMLYTTPTIEATLFENPASHFSLDARAGYQFGSDKLGSKADTPSTPFATVTATVKF